MEAAAHPKELASGLNKCCLALDGATRLTAAECSALLAALESSSPATSACAIKMLRAKAARVERDHAVAVEFGQHGGVGTAVRAIAGGILERDAANECTGRLRSAANGAAALADMVAAAGANKLLALRYGGDTALLSCIEQHTQLAEGGSAEPSAELSLQAMRALGNLCYGWDVDAVKASIGPRGAALVVDAMRAHLAAPQPLAAAGGPAAASLFRWEASWLRPLSSPLSLSLSLSCAPPPGTAPTRRHSAGARAAQPRRTLAVDAGGHRRGGRRRRARGRVARLRARAARAGGGL